jgi:dTDP-4-amino-4,6-dideoxygalactose transaminase
MDTLQAAILRVKRPHLAAWTARRRRNAERYRELLAETPLILPGDAPGHVWHQFVVRAPKRDELRAHLRERAIETEVYYPKPLHRQTPFATGTSLPHAERACGEVLALPVHPHLTDDDVAQIAAAVGRFYARSSG